LVELKEVLVSFLAFAHQEVSLATHQIRILKVWETRDAVANSLQSFIMLANFSLDDALEK
jgi:hypothetical protein